MISLLAWAGTSAGYAQAGFDADAESKIVAMEHVWAQAYTIKDPKALAAILDDGFVCVTSEGKVLSKAEVLADVRTSTALQILTESMLVHPARRYRNRERDFSDKGRGARKALYPEGAFCGYVDLQEWPMGLSYDHGKFCRRLRPRAR